MIKIFFQLWYTFVRNKILNYRYGRNHSDDAAASVRKSSIFLATYFLQNKHVFLLCLLLNINLFEHHGVNDKDK